MPQIRARIQSELKNRHMSGVIGAPPNQSAPNPSRVPSGEEADTSHVTHTPHAESELEKENNQPTTHLRTNSTLANGLPSNQSTVTPSRSMLAEKKVDSGGNADIESDSDEDFQVQPPTKKFIRQKDHSCCSGVSNSQCPEQLREILPPSDEYSYVIEEFKPCTNAPHDTPSFETTLRINLADKSMADQWLKEFMSQSNCTYRLTKTTKPALKRVLAKYSMHCHHFRKPLSQKQSQARLQSHSRSKKNPLIAGMRNKKTQCPSRLTLTLLVPTQKQLRLAESDPHLLSHKAVLRLEFTHNHPVFSAHALSFRPVHGATKEKIFTLFSKGHSAASARHAYETELVLQCVEDGRDVQRLLADRAMNPNVKDYSRFYNEWRKNEMGEENGPGMFTQLQAEVEIYNKQNESRGGKAKIQLYECPKKVVVESSSDDDDLTPPPQKKLKLNKKAQKAQPMVLAICTPLMARAHQNIPQAGEMIFCDATSTLDRLNTSLFIISTSTPTSGIPLGVIVTSDEQESTVRRGLELLGDVMPEGAFHGKGVRGGPSIVMTDDSKTERGAIQSFWPDALLLLCTFHFLQCRWTWLLDSKNSIAKDDRATLIGKVKELVYARTDTELSSQYQCFLKAPEVLKYPKFSHQMQLLWPRRQEWAHCYRRACLVRGNHTNNYAEAGMRILKELVFSRVKAYNLVQMFHFITEVMERYYQGKIISIAHSRVDRFISLRYQGLNAKAYCKDIITDISKGCFEVPSKTERGVVYHVDMAIGVCTCRQGQDGSPCSHQAAVALNFGCPTVNCIPVLDPEGKRRLAFIAYGKDAVQDLSFYATLNGPIAKTSEEDKEPLDQDFSATCWDHIRLGAVDETVDQENDEEEQLSDVTSRKQEEELCNAVDAVAEDIKKRLKADMLFQHSIKKFTTTYEKLSNNATNAYLTSASHKFGWCFGGTITRMQGGVLRRGRRIPIQAKSAGRRRKTLSRGKAPAAPGRVPAGAARKEMARDDRYFIPGRQKNNSVKRLHSLQDNIRMGQQNAGKW